MSLDTPDAKQLAAERRVPGELLLRLIGLATDALVAVNPQGCIVLASEGTEHLFGYQQDELVGLPLQQLMLPRSSNGRITDGQATCRDLFTACSRVELSS